MKHSRIPRPRVARAGLGACALVAAALMPGFAPPAQDDGVDAESAHAVIGDTRTALEEWGITRRLISQEKRDWTLGREVLRDRIDVMRSEIESFTTRIEEAQATIAETDEKRAELFEENEALKASSRALTDKVVALEARTRALLARLPEPIREKVKPLSQRFPEPEAETKLSLGERFQNIVGVLNEVNKFHREITVTSEVRALPDGTSVEVTSLYLGVSQGYYANANGTLAGVGTSTSGGWVWRQANEAAPRIRDAIAIVNSEQAAAFVPLPVQIDAEIDS